MKKKIVVSAPRFYGIDEAIREAFETAGFEATLLNYRTQSTLQETLARKLGIQFPILKTLVNPFLRFYLAMDNREFLAAVHDQKPDLLFLVKGDHILPETLTGLKKDISCPMVAYIWDDPFYSYAGQFADDYRKTNFEKGMRQYDFIFVYDTYYVRKLEKRGLTNVSYLPLAADPKGYSEIKITSEDRQNYDYDISFVGVPYPNRVEMLDSLSRYNLGVFGDGWIRYFLKRGSKPPPYYKGRASGEKVIRIYLSSKIVLNIHDPEAKEGLNTRTFDILACGARELVDYKKNLDDHFKVGEEIIAYRDAKDLHRLTDYYLQHMQELDEVSERGRKRVLREHTWHHRIEQLIRTLSERRIISH